MPTAPRRIWVVLPNWVGDAVMATPTLRALRRSWPEAHIAVEGRRHLEPLLAGHPGFDRFVAAPPKGLGAMLAHARRMRREGFDLAVLLPDSQRAGFAPWLAGVPQRVGYARELVRRTLLTLALPPPSVDGVRTPVSMIERYLAIARALGCDDAGPELELPVGEEERARIRERLASLGVAPDERLAVITPGASFGASKLWPTGHFAAACDGLAKLEDRGGPLRCVLAPGPGEQDVARAIVERAALPLLCLDDPPTDLAELSALVADASLVLTNDTGPRHLAVAHGVPVVTVMGPTDPRHTAHLLEHQRVLREDVPCSPCHLKTCPIDHRCMTRLAPARAVEAAAELLA